MQAPETWTSCGLCSAGGGNGEAARLAVLECMKTHGGNTWEVARASGIRRPVVYDILKKEAEGHLTPRSRVSKYQPNETYVIRTPD